jgi:hypothetical protein
VENQTTVMQHTTATPTANKFLFVVICLSPFSHPYDCEQSFCLSAERQLEILNARKKAHFGMWMQAVTSPVELIKYGDSDKSGQ